MTREEKIKFLAELDGWKWYSPTAESISRGYPKWGYWISPVFTFRDELKTPPNYLSSYDAIIRLVQKQPRNILTQIVLSMKGQNDVSRMVDWLMFSPEELADILIKVIKVDKAEAMR